MSRCSLVLTAATAALLLPDAAHAQRCPYMAQHQLQLQIQLQQQMRQQMQRQMAMQQRGGQMRPPQMLVRPPRPGDLQRMQARNRRMALDQIRSRTPVPTVNVHRIRETTIRREMELIALERRRLQPPDLLPDPGKPNLQRWLQQIRRQRQAMLTQTRTSVTARQRNVAQQRQRIFRATNDQALTSRKAARKQALRQGEMSRAQNLQQTREKQRKSYQHSANVQARLTTKFQCGSCHKCAGNPSIVQGGRPMPAMRGNNPAPPMQVGNQPRQPALRAPGKPLDLLRNNRNPDFPAMVWLPKPGARLTALPRRPGVVLVPPALPMLQQPDLPPLGIVLLDPPAPARRIAERKANPREEKKKQAGAPGLALDEAPPLPRMRGTDGLNPLLEGSKESLVQQARAPAAELLPDAVVAAPPLSPLPGLRPSDRGLLPTLDRDSRERDAFDLAARPSALDLVLQPPPLPDVFLR